MAALELLLTVPSCTDSCNKFCFKRDVNKVMRKNMDHEDSITNNVHSYYTIRISFLLFAYHGFWFKPTVLKFFE